MASNNLQVLSQCAAIFQVAGFQYFSMKNLIKEKDRKYPTLGYIIYFIFSIFLTPACFITLFLITINLGVRQSVKEQLSVKTVLSTAIENLTGFGFLVVSITGIFNSFIKTNHMKKFFLNFDTYRQISMKSSFEEINYESFKVHVFGNFLTTIILVIILGVFTRMYDVEMLPFPLSLMIEIPFTVCLMSIQMILYHVIFVNTHLDHLKVVFKSFLSPLDKTEVSVIVVENRKKSSLMSTKIKSAKKLYNIIKESNEIFNKHKGFVILLNFIYFSLVTVLYCFKLFIGMLGKNTHTSSKLFKKQKF
jgi:hypothetical protein